MQSALWWKDSACLEVEGALELFEASEKFISKKNKARSICRACLVRKDCLEEAFKDNIEGWYGGTTFNERQLMASIMLATGRTLDDLYDSKPQSVESESRKEIRPYTENTQTPELFPAPFVLRLGYNPLDVEAQRIPPVPKLRFAS